VTVGCGEQATRERTLKIAIMGSGAIGGYYGARLQQGGADVTFIARGEQLKAFRQNGIALEGDRPIHLPTVKATDDPATIGKVDMVIFSVKLRDTESAAKQILPLIGPDTGIISLQNGVSGSPSESSTTKCRSGRKLSSMPARPATSRRISLPTSRSICGRSS
jgi:predicted dinucleotide-binding enzyme